MANAAAHNIDNAPSVITMTNVNKWYGQFHVLSDINLDVKEGEKIVICGPSGSGKSTLIRCINRLEEHQAGDLAHRKHARGVPVPAIDNQGDIDIDNITVAQGLFIGYAVAHHMIDRGAHGMAIAAKKQGCGNGAMFMGKFERHAIQLGGGHAGHHLGGQHIESLGRQPTGGAHAGKPGLVVQGNDAGGAATVSARGGVCDHGFQTRNFSIVECYRGGPMMGRGWRRVIEVTEISQS